MPARAYCPVGSLLPATAGLKETPGGHATGEVWQTKPEADRPATRYRSVVGGFKGVAELVAYRRRRSQPASARRGGVVMGQPQIGVRIRRCRTIARMAIDPTSQTPIITADEMAARMASSCGVGGRSMLNGPTSVYVESPVISPDSDLSTCVITLNGNVSVAGHRAHCHHVTPSSVVRISHSARLI